MTYNKHALLAKTIRDAKQTLETIVSCAATHYGMAVADVMSGRALKPSWVRQVTMAMCSELTEATLSEIGDHFDRDHTTVIHAKRVVAERCDVYQGITKDIEELREKIRAALEAAK